MGWGLPFLFIRLTADMRGTNGLASLIPESSWSLLVVSLMLLAIGVMASRHSILLPWSRFQRRTAP
jgi:hypothetical protein